MPEALVFNLNFLHPLLMWGLLAGSGYALFLGIKAKKTRTASAFTFHLCPFTCKPNRKIGS